MTIRITTQGSCCMVDCRTQNPKGTLHHPSTTAQPVAEYPFIDVQASAGQGFHQPGSEEENITNEEVLNLGPVVHQ